MRTHQLRFRARLAAAVATVGAVAATTLALPGTAYAAPPSNDAFASYQMLAPGANSVTGTNAEATKEATEPNHAGNAGGKSVWFRWDPRTSGLVTLDTFGSDFDTLLAVYRKPSTGLIPVAHNDDASGDLLTSRLTFDAVATVPYYIVVDGYNDGSGAEAGNLRLRVRPLPTITGTIGRVSEAAGTVVMSATLSAPAGKPVSVDYGFASGAVNGMKPAAVTEFSGPKGTFSFAPGETTKSVTVSILNDNIDEPDETFLMLFSNVKGAKIGSAGHMVIADDEALPVLTVVGEVTFSEASPSAIVTVRLSHPSEVGIRFRWATSNGTALAGSDYTAANSTYTLPISSTQTTFSTSTSLINDTLREPAEYFFGSLMDPVNATLGQPSMAKINITSND